MNTPDPADLPPLSANAARLLAALDAANSKATVPRTMLLETFTSTFPTIAAVGTTRQALAALIDELTEHHELSVPSDRTRWDAGRPALPEYVRLLRAILEPKSLPARVWRPELAWAASLNLTRTQNTSLLAINRWLRDRSSASGDDRLPMRERSYEIFGDEKRLESLLSTSLFAPGRLDLDMLHSYRQCIPLATRTISAAPTVLVVENSDTFHSLETVLRADPGPIGHLAYGAGQAFESAVADLQTLPEIERIWYFGDLDANGLAIPARASVTAQSLNLPAVEPASRLYEALLEREPGSGATVEADRAANLTAWLPTSLSNQSQRLLESGRRLAQEALNRIELQKLLEGATTLEMIDH
jgi:hypothetical protein